MSLGLVPTQTTKIHGLNSPLYKFDKVNLVKKKISLAIWW